MHATLALVLVGQCIHIHYDQGRTVVQVLGPLHRIDDLQQPTGEGCRLTAAGARLVATLAAWFHGRPGHVLVRKGLVPLLEADAKRYVELRRVKFASPRRERGWNAAPETIVFAGMGRYAKSAAACEREAFALRSYLKRQTGRTALLDQLERPPRPLVFQGRGSPLRYRGELVERPTRVPKDGLAALIQDADRVGTVRQFIGRDRSGSGQILLLRGDPTIGADALIEERDLPEATPIDVNGPGGKHGRPRT